MTINIGNKNKIKKSNIGHQFTSNNAQNQVTQNQTLFEKHPVLISFLISFVAGFIMLFSFWETVINWIENYFK
ncbi:hypothetical protein KHA93_06610 [Bacillus sp. FJAT-49732]|uniref:Uncharacterized protein n=1 Tax=Lederbergia citrisecunda TaxID=2833583 RepID=A0A942YKJ0_9BACI|nr:hypothetical protein [Lederbergia citrisecunda]MBS4199324.1 hypothetical protein [Lederbergia citrisecunda]